ncbi:DUF2798 domain-containing protein [Vibrio aquaticus]|uniref:DUF2798 domain-containing protein n=1 Tax=Vibrio aquaticus TaxID=2496559 RepID=A0A3S0PRB7_9VIBR|nr:DUF2798 domain-containing protein [Vibrio aquaticus]
MTRTQFWITSVLSSFSMAVLMSGIITASKVGFNDLWPAAWLSSLIIAWPCALLLNFTILPKIKMFSEWLATKVSATKSTNSEIKTMKVGFRGFSSAKVSAYPPRVVYNRHLH